MKSLTKFVILTTVFLVFESCQEKNTVLIPNEDNYVVSLKEASNVAENIVSSQNSSQKNAKTGATKKIKQQRSVLDESDNQPIMHIFNYENNEGFLIISGDKRLMPYIAYSSTGEFDLSLSKPGINLWTSYVKDVVKLAKSNKEKQHPAAKNAWSN